MIKNEKQYNVTQKKFFEFKHALDIMQEHFKDKPEEFELRAQFIHAEMDKLGEDIDEYEQLKDRRKAFISIPDLSHIAELLIKGRILKGWTHSELAEKLNMKEQQVQRYESTDYETASLARIIQIFKVLELDVKTCKIGYGEPKYLIPGAEEIKLLKVGTENLKRKQQLLSVEE